MTSRSQMGQGEDESRRSTPDTVARGRSLLSPVLREEPRAAMRGPR